MSRLGSGLLLSVLSQYPAKVLKLHVAMYQEIPGTVVIGTAKAHRPWLAAPDHLRGCLAPS